MIGSVPFARYNLRLGRGDTRGAIRLGLFVLCMCLGSWLIGGTHVAGAGEVDLFLMAVMRSVFGAVTLALTYISFEPFVRRHWPQTIISWSRVLAGAISRSAGRTRCTVRMSHRRGAGADPSSASLLYRRLWEFRAYGSPPIRSRWPEDASWRDSSYSCIVDTLNKSLGILFLIFLARMLLRKQWLAAGVVVVALAGMYATNEAESCGSDGRSTFCSSA